MMLPWNMKSFIKILEISLTHINIQTLVTIIKNKKKTIVVRVTAQILFGKRIPLNTIIGDISSNSKKKCPIEYTYIRGKSPWIRKFVSFDTQKCVKQLPDLKKIYPEIHKVTRKHYMNTKMYRGFISRITLVYRSP